MCDAAALSLGRARGAVLVGRPLQVTIPVTLDSAGEEPCASAELFYGENKVGRAPTVRWEPASGGQGVLRVTSDLPVDEPMVTVYLRVGCGAQSSTRRYVMLSEPPPDVEPLAPNRPGVQLPTVPAAPVAPPQAAAPAAPAARATPRATSPRRDTNVAGTPAPAPAERVERVERTEPAVRAPGRAVPPSPAPRARREAAQAQAQAQPRLKLEPLDLSEDRDPTLRLTSELGTQVAADPQQRNAAAALWQVLQRGPEASVQEALRLQAAERELKSLHDLSRQNAAAVTQLRNEVEEARNRRSTASFFVMGLAVLLMALLGWLAWRWHRAAQVARVGRWFEANATVQAPLAGAATVDPNVPAATKAAPTTAAVVTATKPAADPAAQATPASAKLAALTPGDDYQVSRGGSVRMVGVQEVIDVHDKADFFLSIGEPDQAIAVLEAHVHDQVETSALAWMDLLELYHSLGKRVEYERLRGEFRQRFSAQVPDFEHFDQPTASLENYSRALSRIVALWPSRRVLDVIEESIFRKPGLPGAEPFSLEAYRELVMLYHVARELAPEPVDPSQPGVLTSFPETSLQPLNMLDRPEPTVADQDRLMVPPSSPRLGLDIDLDAEPAEAADRADTLDPARAELPPLDFDISASDELPPKSHRG